VRFPVALPYLFSGLRAAAALSVVGAIVAELPVGSNTGIGQIIYNAAEFYNFDPAALWASTVAAFALGAGFFLAVVLLEWLARLAIGDRGQR
jgi:NitT/TauT family transport system permease protein